MGARRVSEDTVGTDEARPFGGGAALGGQPIRKARDHAADHLLPVRLVQIGGIGDVVGGGTGESVGGARLVIFDPGEVCCLVDLGPDRRDPGRVLRTGAQKFVPEAEGNIGAVVLAHHKAQVIARGGVFRITREGGPQGVFGLRRDVAAGGKDHHVAVSEVVGGRCVGPLDRQHQLLCLVGGGEITERGLVAGQQGRALQIAGARGDGIAQLGDQHFEFGGRDIGGRHQTRGNGRFGGRLIGARFATLAGGIQPVPQAEVAVTGRADARIERQRQRDQQRQKCHNQNRAQAGGFVHHSGARHTAVGCDQAARDLGAQPVRFFRPDGPAGEVAVHLVQLLAI